MLFKLQELEEILCEKGQLPALKFASKINCLGKYRDVIQKGWAAHSNPEFYRELGHDPQRLVDSALLAISQLLEESK